MHSGVSAELPRDLAALWSGRADLRESWTLHHLHETRSTNDVLLAMAHDGAPFFTVVVAESQTAGRGRRGHAWSSPSGGLYFSVLLPAFERHAPSLGAGAVDLPTGPSPWLTIMAGLAAAAAIRTVSRVDACLKWPNDVIVHEPRGPLEHWRKLGGVLAEGVTTGSRVRAVVVGIGINLRRASHAEEVDALSTSLEQQGVVVDRGSLFGCLLDELREGCGTLEGRGETRLRERFLTCSPLSSRGRVRWATPHGERAGVACGVDADGALLVRTSQGEERLVGGDVRWERHGTLA